MLNTIETIEQEKILKLLSRALPYYLESWQDIDGRTGLFGTSDPRNFNMRSVGSSSPVIEYVIRPHLNILCILSSYHYLNKQNIIQDYISPKELEEKLINGLRWACQTHLTGSRDVDAFLERKRWGENWRSSLWASILAITAVFAKDLIDSNLEDKIKLIVAFEADRFIGVNPPSGCDIDTKVEENAQDMMIVAWAINLNPQHPNLQKWQESLRLWAVNIASSIHDKADHNEYFSESIAKAVSTENLFPDLTAENHGFFHPEVLSYGIWIVLATAAYTLHGREYPSFLHRKSHQKTFETLLRFCLPSGMIYAPGGHDLPMFIPRPLALAWGLWKNDPRALHLTGKLLSWMESTLLPDHENREEGPWVFGFNQNHEGWELLFQTQTGVELALLAALPFNMEQRTFSAGQVENAINTRHIYPYTEVCYRRNVRTTRSMAWKALGDHPLAGINIHSKPELVAPFRAALFGIPSVSDTVKSWKVLHHKDRFQRDGFDTSGKVCYFNTAGKNVISREMRVLTWGDEGFIVLDRITAQSHFHVHEQYLSPVYLVNDFWTDNNLELNTGSLKETFSAFQRKFREVSCPSFWASIDNHLMFQFVWKRTKGLHYLPGGEKNAPPYWKNCRLDMLGIHVEPLEVKEGTVFYEVGFYIGTGKGPRPFKSSGTAQEYFKGLVIMDGKNTVGLD